MYCKKKDSLPCLAQRNELLLCVPEILQDSLLKKGLLTPPAILRPGPFPAQPPAGFQTGPDWLIFLPSLPRSTTLPGPPLRSFVRLAEDRYRWQEFIKETTGKNVNHTFALFPGVVEFVTLMIKVADYDGGLCLQT